jgi:hypothetical protein
VVVGAGLAPARLEDTSIPNPFGLIGPAGAVAGVLANTGTLLWAATMVASLACVVVRFRSSGGVERQQLRWVAAGAVAAVAGLLAGAAAPQQTVISSVLYAMVLCIPLAVAVAVLRYRLWDLDRIISRTVAYALLSLLLGLGYAAVVLGLGRLLPDSSTLVVAAATLAVAAVFSPLRRRVQELVDRRFNRRRHDAAQTIAAFSAHLRDQVDLDTLSAELVTLVDQTMQPTRASLWLRQPGAASRRDGAASQPTSASTPPIS